MPALIDMIRSRRIAGHRPWPRAVVERRRLALRHRPAGGRPLDAARPVGRQTQSQLGAVHMAVLTSVISRLSRSNVRADTIRPLGRCIRPPSGWNVRLRDLFGIEPVGLPDARPWLDLGFWDVQHPLGHAPRPAGGAHELHLPAGRRREPASDSGRPGARRDHRAGALPLHRQRRNGGAARAAPGLCPQGHRRADGGRHPRARPRAWPAAPRATARSRMPSPSPTPSKRRWRSRFRRARAICAR